jgi:dipeptidase E
MKLLLTSAGITNKSIANALEELVGKPADQTRIGFIPTADNIEAGSKEFLLGQYDNLRRYGYSWIDIIDPSSAGVDWLSRLEKVDLVFISGGNTFHLLDQTRRSGLGDWLREMVDRKVYVGVSAGSIILTPNIAIASVDDGDENLVGLTDLNGLSIVDFEISPHTPEWVSYEANNEYAKDITNRLYMIDDETAVKVVDGIEEVVSEGEWRLHTN